jgi:hypothetical protein
VKIIAIAKQIDGFAENKDVARTIRIEDILPYLEKGESVTLDFKGVSGATQSFIHALISEAIRIYGDEVYDKLVFKNCSPEIQEIVNIVADYMEES